MGREKGTDKIEGGAFSGVNILQLNPLFGVLYIGEHQIMFLSDPGIPGVRSMGRESL